MKEIKLPPFYAGQMVVVVNAHPKHRFKNGDVFQVKEVHKGCCDYHIRISNDSNPGSQVCYKCGHRDITFHDWYSADRFMPLDEIKFPSLSLQKVIEKESELVSMN
jgi:hypothetical protein